MQESRDYAVMEPASDELLFSEIYHSLIHSQSLDSLLSVEDKYAADMHRLLDDRDRNIASIEARSAHCISRIKEKKELIKRMLQKKNSPKIHKKNAINVL